MTQNPISVVYLLEDTVMFGGVKVVLRQADLLHSRNHNVVIISKGPRPTWYDVEAPFVTVDAFNRKTVPEASVVVATYWATIQPALDLENSEIVHYCQGYEASYTHNVAEHEKIVAAYSHPVPAMVVSPHLQTLLIQKFNRVSRLVLQPLESFWAPPFHRRTRIRPHRPARILVAGPWEGDWKGVPTGLRAVKNLRERGVDVKLVRLSQYPLSDEESALLKPDEYHHHISPQEAAHLVRSCDLLLAPSWEQEGFGLPVLEAMAAGVPVVASDISCFRGFAADAAALVPHSEPEAFAAAAGRLLDQPRLWRRSRSLGLRAAQRFHPDNAIRSAEKALRWVASGAWRNETDPASATAHDESPGAT